MHESLPPLPPIPTSLSELRATALDLLSRIPGSAIAWRYLKASHQNDPLRSLLELALVFFVIRTYAQSRTKGDASGKNFVKLSEREIDELVDEWQPEPLLPEAPDNIPYPPIIIGPSGPKPRVLLPTPGQDPYDAQHPLVLEGGKQLTNLASYNFAGLAGNERIKDKAIECLRRYGVGSCGPPGFYGTFDVHMELERDIAAFLNVPASIIYSHSFSTPSSVIPSFCKRGDIIVADRGVSFSIQKGILISRSTVRWYDHGDYDSLERVLESIRKEDKRYRRKPTASRRFIITEGVFENDGSMVNLPRILELRDKYQYRVLLEETWSFGIVGKTGRGVTEVFDVPASEVDILTGSMAIGLGVSGGFCAGSMPVVTHQRINSPAFVFSAAMPPLLAVASSEVLRMYESEGAAHPLSGLQELVRAFRNIVDAIPTLECPSSALSPMIHLFIRPSTTSNSSVKSELPREEQEKLLQDIVDHCAENGYLITRPKRNWAQESPEQRPSIRVCISTALSKKEVEKGGQAIKSAAAKVLGKRR